MNNTFPLCLVLAHVSAGCTLVNAPKTSTRDGTAPLAYYEVDPRNSGAETRIDFYEDRIIFSHARSSPESRAQSDAGRGIRFNDDGRVYSIEDEPFFAPREGVSEWTTEKFRCNADHIGQSVSIKCVSKLTGRTYSSLYSEGRGIEWFDYFCDSSSNETCRYELRSTTGLFSKGRSD